MTYRGTHRQPNEGHMLKAIERPSGTVEVEIDAPQGRILLVSCADHGGMAERLSNPAWVCTTCQREFTKLEALALIDQCYAEIRQHDRDTNRQETAAADARMQARLTQRRGQQ